jgi:RHS repeat-associated protein
VGQSLPIGNYSYDFSKVQRFGYYGNGLLGTKTDKNGQIISYTYDVHGRMISQAVGSITITYTYDNNGNMLTVTDVTGTTTRTYDSLNRVTSKDVSAIGISDKQSLRYFYDSTYGGEGYVSENSMDFNDNYTTKTYDKVGRLVRVQGGIDTAEYSYYDNGNLKSVVYSNGTRTDFTYTQNSLVKTMVNKKSDGSIIESYSYTYDKCNNMLSKTDSKGTTTYSYDSLNRLSTVTEPGEKYTSYTYDKAGNRATSGVSESTKVTITHYEYDAQNKLLSTTKEENGNKVEVITYSYDNNGNLTKQTRTPYDSNGNAGASADLQINTYDELNRMTRTVTSAAIVDNAYNGEGYRVKKTVTNRTTGLVDTTYFLYDYDKVVLELNGNKIEKAWNIYGLSLIVRKAGVDTLFYLYNSHADVTALTDRNGNIVATYTYDAFGNITDHTGDKESSILYAGYQYDKETGLYYLNSRMYDPVTARFMQEDSYTGQYDDPLSLNLYTYCSNGPLMYNDPTGHWGNFFKWVGNAVKTVVTTVATVVVTVAKVVYNTAKTVYNKTKKFVKNLIKDPKKTITNVVNKVTKEVKEFVEDPAKKMAEIKAKAEKEYKEFQKKVAIAIKESHEQVTRAYEKAQDNLTKQLKSVSKGIAEGFDGIVKTVDGAIKDAGAAIEDFYNDHKAAINIAVSALTIIGGAAVIAFTAGAATPFVAGAMIGAGGSLLLSTGIDYADNGRLDNTLGDSFKAFAEGGITGLFMPMGAGLSTAGKVGWTAVSAMMGNGTAQLVTTGKVDYKEVATTTTLALGLGTVLAKAAPLLKKIGSLFGKADDAAESGLAKVANNADDAVVQAKSSIATQGADDAAETTGKVVASSAGDRVVAASSSGLSRQPLRLSMQQFAEKPVNVADDVAGATASTSTVTGGNSTTLGKNMMESMGLKRSTKWTGHQAQHIIPAEMTDNPVIQKIGMNLDDATNGIFLRTPDSSVSAMSRHRGYHSVYNDTVRNQLNRMDINQSVDVLQKQVSGLQRDLRNLQESGLPLYPNQGATVDLWERSLSRIKR